MAWRSLALMCLLAVGSAAVARADVVEVTGWQVNVRERPSRSAPVIVTLYRGERFALLGREASWYHVRIASSGRVGYVHSSLVRVVPGAALPEAEAARPETRIAPAAPPTPAPTKAAPPPPTAATATPAPAAPAATSPAPAPKRLHVPAPAAPPPPPPAPVAAEAPPERFDLGFQAGVRFLTAAKRSAEALFDGESSGFELGGFASYAITRNVFVMAGAQVFRKEGQRVLVTDPEGPVVPLGHPLKLRLIPAYLVVGYRFHPSPSLVPYLAVGGGATFYREESTIGLETESFSSTKGMGMALVGLDYVKNRVVFGVQASWSTVPNALGAGGVSAVYGEDDLGGLSVSARLGVTF